MKNENRGGAPFMEETLMLIRPDRIDSAVYWSDGVGE